MISDRVRAQVARWPKRKKTAPTASLVGPFRYQSVTLGFVKVLVLEATASKELVYVIDQRLVTDVRTYWISDAPVTGERLARKLGIQTVDDDGELYWPRHPVVRWMRQLFRRN